MAASARVSGAEPGQIAYCNGERCFVPGGPSGSTKRPYPLLVTDPIFTHPRLAQIYDFLDGERSDLDFYLGLVKEFEVNSVVDIGCGTGSLASLLALEGVRVTAVDPAAASLDVARTKPGAERVTWVHGDAGALPDIQADLVTMTGNVAQVFVTDAQWDATLRSARRVLRPRGRLVFETRDPGKKAWLNWNRDASHRHCDIDGVGLVELWVDLLDQQPGLVTFRWTFKFASDDTTLTSDSTLRFRSREEIEQSLFRAGLTLEEVRDAPDRPSLELMCIARRESP